MSRRQYRRNGTPIGDRKVYALALRKDRPSDVFEIEPHGIETYEDLEGLVALEQMAGKFGYDYDRLVITRPGVDLSGKSILDIDISGSNLSGSHFVKSRFEGSTLDGVDFSGADLSRADLLNTYMSGTVLYGSKLIGAYMEGVNIEECRFDKETDFSSAYLPDGPVPYGWSRDNEGLLTRWKSRRRR